MLSLWIEQSDERIVCVWIENMLVSAGNRLLERINLIALTLSHIMICCKLTIADRKSHGIEVVPIEPFLSPCLLAKS